MSTGFTPWLGYQSDGATRGSQYIDFKFDIQSHYAFGGDDGCAVWFYWYL